MIFFIGVAQESGSSSFAEAARGYNPPEPRESDPANFSPTPQFYGSFQRKGESEYVRVYKDNGGNLIAKDETGEYVEVKPTDLVLDDSIFDRLPEQGLTVLVLILAIGGAAWYFSIRKSVLGRVRDRKQTKDRLSLGAWYSSIRKSFLDRVREWKQTKRRAPLNTMNNINYFFLSGKTPKGPFNEYQIRSLINNGKITHDTCLWHEDLDEWKPLEMFPELLVEKSEEFSSKSTTESSVEFFKWCSASAEKIFSDLRKDKQKFLKELLFVVTILITLVSLVLLATFLTRDTGAPKHSTLNLTRGAGEYQPASWEQQRDCWSCRGTGKQSNIPCHTCGRNGVIRSRSGYVVVCPTCSGLGSLGGECSSCGGDGRSR